ncbi:MAG: D-alanine--D-alanine ligase family protein [Clostridia bacterium]
MKKNIAVIFGGKSSEYEVSLRSVSCILENVDKEKYNIINIGITKEGNWLLYSGETENIRNASWVNDPQNVSVCLSPDRSTSGIIAFYPDKTTVIKIDVIFPVLHGKNGEDGTIQGLFALSGIPYVGCGCLSSAVCMDKAITHCILNGANIEQAHYLWFYADRYEIDAEKIRNKITARLKYPVFVKPANAGSSVGVSKVSSEDELDIAIKKAIKEDIKIVVEEGVFGKEIECSVMGNRNAVAAEMLGEVVTGADFYDYDDKYTNGVSQTLIPATISPELTQKLREIAVRAYRYLGCAGLSRVDFFVTDEGKIILNEINTLPGFTEISMYSKLWIASGVSLTELVDKLIDSAFDRYE